MINFKHILITRFNLPQRWEKDRKGNVVLDSVWLEERFDLFEKFCLPSILGQTSKNFEWWVYFDLNTNPVFKRRIQIMVERHPFLKSKFEKSYDDFETNMPKDISNIIKKENANWLITTRLDNDDMLAKNTIEILQKRMVFQNNTLLEIPCGYTLELGLKSKLRLYKSKLNPFISYVEKIEIDKVVKSVYFYQHTEWRDVDSVIVTNRPQWVQVIHDKNVINGINGELSSPLNFPSRFIFNKDILNLNVSYKLRFKLILKRFKIEYLVRKLMK